MATDFNSTELAERLDLTSSNLLQFTVQLREWAAGTATGGPNSDGLYPLSVGITTYMVPSPAKMVASTQKGDTAGVQLTFSTTTADADPGPGKIRANNASLASATALYVDNVDFYGNSLTAFLDSFDDSTNSARGLVYLQDTSNAAKFAVFEVTGSVVDGTGYRKLTVAHRVSGSALTDGSKLAISFARAGDRGTNGWAPVITSVADGARRVLRVLDWVGGEGTKPSTGYVASTGIVATAAEGDDFFAAITAQLSTLATAVSDAAASKTAAETAAASIAFLYDVNSVRYYYGKTVVSAAADPNDIPGWVVTEDGFMYAKWAIRTNVANGLRFEKNVADGFYELSLGTTAGVIPLGTDGATVEAGSLRYFGAGYKVLWSVSDPNDRAPLFVAEDGKTYGRFNFIQGDGITITFDGAAMSTRFDVTPLPNPDVLLIGNNGATADPTSLRYFAGKKVTWALGVDPSDHAPLFTTEDGTTYGKYALAPGPGVSIAFDGPTMTTTIGVDAGVNADAPLDTANYLFTTKKVGDLYHVMRTSKLLGTVAQATLAGNNFSPALSADGLNVVYSTDRNGGRDVYFQALAGGTEYPALGLATWTGMGDSMMAGDMLTVAASALGKTLSTPTSGAAGGIGSQQVDQIAGRYDAIPVTCSVTGDTISSGANTLTAISIHILSRASDGAGTVRTLKASINGITGVLTSTQSTSAVAGALTFAGQWYLYSFTPDGGQTLPAAAPAGSALRIILEDRDHDMLFIWMGRNNVGLAGWQDDVKAKLAAMLSRQKNLVRKFCIIGVTNAQTEPSGSANYNAIVAFNADLAALYPGRFFDPRPTFNAGTADDTPAPSLAADAIHYNGAGRTAIGNALAAYLTANGIS